MPNYVFETLFQGKYEFILKLSVKSFINSFKRQDILAAIEINEKFIRAFFEKDSFSSPSEIPYESFEDVEKYQNQLYQWFSCFSEDILKDQFF